MLTKTGFTPPAGNPLMPPLAPKNKLNAKKSAGKAITHPKHQKGLS
jgi:hypothetical protein